MFWNSFNQYGNEIALVSGDIRVSYTELHERCVEFSRLLGDKKSLVLISVDNSIESVVALYGTLMNNSVVIPYDPTNVSLKDNLTSTFSPHFLYSKKPEGWDLEALKGEEDASNIQSDLSMLISTSGSTGSTKCVRLSKKNISANTNSIVQYLSISKEDKAALILPFHYCYGLSVLNTHLSVGAEVHIGDVSVASSSFTEYLYQHEITSFAGVPYSFEILERINFRDCHLPCLRYITQAGGRLAPSKVKLYSEWANAQEKSFFVMYGQTEATSRIAYLPPEYLDDYPGCIGIAIPDGELFIKNEKGQSINTFDEAGELFYRGPNVMMGYAESISDLCKGNEYSELPTGDVACVNNEGLYYIVGRLKRFTKIYGKRFNLDEIERFISSEGTNAACVSDDKTLFVCYEGALGSSVISSLEKKYAIDQQNIMAFKLAEFPLLGSGKLDYTKMLNLSHEYQNQQLNESKNNFYAKKNTKEQLLSAYKKVFKSKKVSSEDSFALLGGDSLLYVNLSIEIEKILGFLPDIWDKKTIKELSSLQSKPSLFAVIEMGIFLRMYCIVAIVVYHSGIGMARGGAVVLLILSGANLARFQIDKLLRGDVKQFLSSLFFHILLPFWGIMLAYPLLKGGNIDVYDIFMLSNNIPGGSQGILPFASWFIAALFQCIALSTLPLLVSSIRYWALSNKAQYIMVVFVCSIILRLIDQFFVLGIEDYFQHITWVYWLFCLGALTQVTISIRDKQLLSVIIVICGIAFYWSDWPRVCTIIIGTNLFLWIKHVSLPRFIVPVVQILSASSLFIYMLHQRAPVNSFAADWSLDIVRIGVGLLLGIAGYIFYNFGLSVLFRLRDQLWLRLKK